MSAPDIFFSYAREDEARIAALAMAIEKRGWAVFWDRRIPAGQTWRSYLGVALTQARCVVVAWSEQSIKSQFVIDEADDGMERGILVPILLDAVRPPLGFRGIHAADLSVWSPKHPSSAFDSFLNDLEVALKANQQKDTANKSEAMTSATECDRAAADPDDKQKHPNALGVPWNALNAAHAVHECKVAVELWTLEPRFAFQYGRALERAGNDVEAARWYRRAADQSYIEALFKLGALYENGRGVAKDAAEAARWYRKAADHGHVRAQHQLGFMYRWGRGVVKDKAEAARWYQRAADQGHEGAREQLSQMESTTMTRFFSRS